MLIKYMSLDPSLTNTAVVWGKLDISKDILYPEGYELINTVKTKLKTIRQSSDLVRRCRTINEKLHELIEDYKPNVVFVETPSGSQNYSGAISYAVSCYLIGTIDPPPIEVTPLEVKMYSAGKGTASKKDIMEYCINKFPDFPYERKKDGTLVEAKMEHVCDSIATSIAGIKSKQYVQLKKLLKDATI